MSGTNGRSGTKKKPLEPRLRRGTVKSAELVGIEIVDVADDGPPAPIRPPGEAGQEFFDRIWGTSPWLQHSDLDVVQQYAEAIDDRQAARSKWLSNMEKHRRSGIQVRRIEKHLLDLATILGLTPSGRASMGLALSRTSRNAAEAVSLQNRGRGSSPKSSLDPSRNMSGPRSRSRTPGPPASMSGANQ